MLLILWFITDRNRFQEIAGHVESVLSGPCEPGEDIINFHTN